MRYTLIPALFVGALAAGAAVGPTPATAQPRGQFFGPGTDGDYQPPAYDRDRVGSGAARSAAAGGLYGGPLYDREPYGFGYSGAGADRLRPDRSDTMERSGRVQFERGYRLGREDERYRRRAQAAHARLLDSGAASLRGAAGESTDGDWDIADLLLAHSRQQLAVREVRQSLQDAQAAMQQNDRARAEAALAQADQKLRMAGPGVGGDRLAAGWVNQAELALERGDQEAARRALREARQAVAGDPGGAPRQAQGQRPADASGGAEGGARPQQGGGQQQGAAAGAGEPPSR